MTRAPVIVLSVAAVLVFGIVGVVLSGRDGSPRTAGPAAAQDRSGDVRNDRDSLDSLAGVNLTAYTPAGYGRPRVRGVVRRIATLGASTITLTPTWYMPTGDSETIRPDRNKTPLDRSLVRAIGWIRQAGLKVALKPHVDVLDGTFRGEIEPGDPARWFRSYRQMIAHYATIAGARDVDLFVVGTELKSLSGDVAAWRDLIREVRSRYPGAITYAANWDEFDRVKFWDDLDLIGVDAYFPLAEGDPDPGFSRLEAAWRPVVASLHSISDRWERPVVLTEAGYPSQAGATGRPWEVVPGEPADEELQARAYRAAFLAFRGRSWLAGINWWSWRADPSPEERPEVDYTPEGKGAERVLRREWASGSAG